VELRAGKPKGKKEQKEGDKKREEGREKK